MVAADIDRAWLDSWTADDDFIAPLRPQFLVALEERIGAVAGNLDAVLVASPLPGTPEIALTRADDSAHSRVARAHGYRADVRDWTSADGVVVLGRGVAGRWETGLEEHRNGNWR
ncbi:hypothetical protein [Actinoplanes sp. NBRC 103695]|uniref:hypothetical protein n=1 Tax=Actinoplanes sp. NBRC 103695 TaxID=3032202 RepID=UPI0024A5BA61|nr:hypothetical protein [Actinoplanes sp. NBRC 103695]GLY96850.1 hypothetical protein Acsp02_41040 [Actinoplanes sp. NBRC 103695]